MYLEGIDRNGFWLCAGFYAFSLLQALWSFVIQIMKYENMKKKKMKKVRGK